MYNFKEIISQCKGIKKQLSLTLNEKNTELEKNKKRIESIELAQTFLQRIAQDTQTQLSFKVEDIVNLALETCFPNEYEFRLDFNIARNKTECSLVFVSKKTKKVIDIMNASGGGVVDVVSFALRVACYILEKNIDNVIILDEPMKFVSKNLHPNICEVIKTLSKKLNLQFIIVTHIQEFVDIADKVFTVKKDSDGVSHII